MTEPGCTACPCVDVQKLRTVMDGTLKLRQYRDLGGAAWLRAHDKDAWYFVVQVDMGCMRGMSRARVREYIRAECHRRADFIADAAAAKLDRVIQIP